MFRACELKDQTYKKTRTLHFSDPKNWHHPCSFAGKGLYAPLTYTSNLFVAGSSALGDLSSSDASTAPVATATEGPHPGSVLALMALQCALP